MIAFCISCMEVTPSDGGGSGDDFLKLIKVKVSGEVTFTNKIKPCAIQLYGADIDCNASNNTTNCLMHTTMDICTKYLDHLVHSE
jgi:hypothetical protein